MEVPSSTVLKNRGYPVRVYDLERDAASGRFSRPFRPRVDSRGEPVVKECWVKFTNLVLSDIEEHYGSITEWAERLQETPYKTCIDTLAIAWRDDPEWSGADRRTVGASFIHDQTDEYAAAVGSGYMLANGVEVDAVVRVLTSGIAMGRERRARALSEALGKVVEEAEQIVQDESEATTSQSSGSPGDSG